MKQSWGKQIDSARFFFTLIANYVDPRRPVYVDIRRRYYVVLLKNT